MPDQEIRAVVPLGDVGRCFDQCPPMFGIQGPVCMLPYGHLGSHESEHGTIWSFMPGVDRVPTPPATALESGAEPPTQVGADPAPRADASHELVAKVLAVTPIDMNGKAVVEWRKRFLPSVGWNVPEGVKGDPAPIAARQIGVVLRWAAENYTTTNEDGGTEDGVWFEDQLTDLADEIDPPEARP